VFQPKAFRSVANGAMVLLMLFLIGFEVVFHLTGDGSYGVNAVALQRTRSQLLVNAVVILVYRPMIEHEQAMRNLQTVLPAFEQEQALLQTNQAADVQSLLQLALNDYLPLTLAIQSVTRTPSNSTIDPSVINILVAHERNYLATMNALMLLLPQHIENSAIQLFVIQVVIEIVFLTAFLIGMTRVSWEVEKERGTKIKLPMRFFMRRLLVFVLTLALIGLEVVPFKRGSEILYLDQANLQQVRCEIFAASALVSTSRPAVEKTLALGDAQVTLLLFQQGQVILLANEDTDVHRHVLQATSEYQTMSTAVQAFIAPSNETVDPTVVNTIVSHTQRCATMMNEIALILQSRMEQKMTLLFFGEVVIESVLIIFFGALFVFSYDPFAPKKLRSEGRSEHPPSA